jgi:hypothetical protein
MSHQAWSCIQQRCYKSASARRPRVAHQSPHGGVVKSVGVNRFCLIGVGGLRQLEREPVARHLQAGAR